MFGAKRCQPRAAVTHRFTVDRADEMNLAEFELLCNAYAMTNAKLLSAKSKAEEMGISRATLSRRVKSGAIKPAYRGEGVNGVHLFYSGPVDRLTVRNSA